jgi:FdhD protein
MTDERVTREMEVLRWRDGAVERVNDLVAMEAHVTFHVEPMGILDIVMAPESLREFIVGHLFCEGLIDGPWDVADVTVADRGDRVEVLVELSEEVVRSATTEGLLDGTHRRGLIQTECGGIPPWRSRELTPVEGTLAMSAAAIEAIPRTVRDRTGLFADTGAFHYAFILDGDGYLLAEAFDVGRHTAVDKAAGRALLEGVDLGSCALYTTGRISSDVARKCVHAGIPVVISRGAPLTGAIGIAEENGLGMVGFLRGGRFNVYAGERHVLLD